MTFEAKNTATKSWLLESIKYKIYANGKGPTIRQMSYFVTTHTQMNSMIMAECSNNLAASRI